jgi:hypothetical protein
VGNWPETEYTHLSIMTRNLLSRSIENAIYIGALRQLTHPQRSSLCHNCIAGGREKGNVLACAGVGIVVETVDLGEVVCPVLGCGLQAVIPL